MERDASPFVAHVLILHYAKTFKEKIIMQFLQISTLLSIKHLWTFASSLIGFKTILQFSKAQHFNQHFQVQILEDNLHQIHHWDELHN